MKEAHTSSPATVSHMKKASLQIGLQRSKPISPQRGKMGIPWDDVFQSFDLRHAFLLDKLKMDKEAIAAEIAQTAGDEKSKDTADALTALVAN